MTFVWFSVRIQFFCNVAFIFCSLCCCTSKALLFCFCLIHFFAKYFSWGWSCKSSFLSLKPATLLQKLLGLPDENGANWPVVMHTDRNGDDILTMTWISQLILRLGRSSSTQMHLVWETYSEPDLFFWRKYERILRIIRYVDEFSTSSNHLDITKKNNAIRVRLLIMGSYEWAQSESSRGHV